MNFQNCSWLSNRTKNELQSRGEKMFDALNQLKLLKLSILTISFQITAAEATVGKEVRAENSSYRNLLLFSSSSSSSSFDFWNMRYCTIHPVGQGVPGTFLRGSLHSRVHRGSKKRFPGGLWGYQRSGQGRLRGSLRFNPLCTSS